MGGKEGGSERKKSSTATAIRKWGQKVTRSHFGVSRCFSLGAAGCWVGTGLPGEMSGEVPSGVPSGVPRGSGGTRGMCRRVGGGLLPGSHRSTIFGIWLLTVYRWSSNMLVPERMVLPTSARVLLSPPRWYSDRDPQGSDIAEKAPSSPPKPL